MELSKKMQGRIQKVLEEYEDPELGFMARSLVQTTLPHRDVGKVNQYSRESGNITLTVQPAITVKDGKEINYGIPYGSIPRLVLTWLSTEVVKTKNQKVELGDSLSSFMRELDLLVTGGKWGSIPRLKKQVERLFRSRFMLSVRHNQGVSEKDFVLAQERHFFWDVVNPDQESLFKSSIVISSGFYEELITKPVPIDLRVIKLLKQSPLAIDLYAWLTYRNSYLQKETLISWEKLALQFGSNYKEIRIFKLKVGNTLKKLLHLYPARTTIRDDGLMIYPSPTSIASKNKGSFQQF
ncbi:MAG: replication protein RepA [Syntrophales bacterium]|nr:replication protein RepA [Syntrophales bacterium]